MHPSMRLRKLHRGVGLIFCLSVLLSAGSGILHNVMSRTQAPPPPARPGGGEIHASEIRVSVQEALGKLPDPAAPIHLISVREIAGTPWYQFLIKGPGKPLYVNAVDGSVYPDQDAVYARQIASDALGIAELRQTDYLTHYTAEYLNIFRILPVYRFDSGDAKGTRVYVSTMTGSVTRSTDDHKQFEANVFTYLHKFGFIADKNLRDLVLTVSTAGVFAAAALGIFLFFATLPPKQ